MLITSAMKTAVAAILAAVLAMTVGGCGHQEETAQTSGGEKYASSMSEYLQMVLNAYEKSPYAGGSQERIVRKSLESGKPINHADYEQAWSDYRQCVVDKGYTEPPLLTAGGFYTDAYSTSADDFPSEAAEQKFNDDEGDCFARNVSIVSVVYQRQQADPQLFSEPEEAAVDCLHQAGLAEASYTAAQFTDEREAYYDFQEKRNSAELPSLDEANEYFTIDLRDQGVMSCIVANEAIAVGALSGDYEPPEWKPLG